MRAGSPLVLLMLLKAPAWPKSAPAAGPWFQEPNFHMLQVRVGSEKLPAMTGNPGNSPKSSWPLGGSKCPVPMGTAAGELGLPLQGHRERRRQHMPGSGAGMGKGSHGKGTGEPRHRAG